MKNKNKDVVLILHNVRSAHNVGAIFRTAEAAGIKKIYLTGYTPAPIDRFGRSRKDIEKTALGAEKEIQWETQKNIHPLMKKLKDQNYFLVALEQSDKAKDYKDIDLPDSCALIVGNEVDGLSEDILSACDVIAEIPLYGEKESLNVSVATGISLFRMLDI